MAKRSVEHDVWQTWMVIVEHALLPVIPGREAEFEAALSQALPIIRAAHGCRAAAISRGIESPSTYLLIVEWDSIEAHDPGFRGSEEYQEWKRLLHHFYDPLPIVEHFEPI